MIKIIYEYEKEGVKEDYSTVFRDDETADIIIEGLCRTLNIATYHITPDSLKRFADDLADKYEGDDVRII